MIDAPTEPGPNWKRLHAFGLPGGSIRALLALAMVGTVCSVLVLCPERAVPYQVQNVMFIILGHYFAVRHRLAPATDVNAGPPPLYLPRGTIRVLMTGGFVAVVIVLYRQGRLLRVADHPGLLTLLLVAGFLLGVILTRLLSAGGRHLPRIVEDLRAFLSLAAAAVMILMVLIELEQLPARGALGDWYETLRRWRAQYISAALVSFYFGSRS